MSLLGRLFGGRRLRRCGSPRGCFLRLRQAEPVRFANHRIAAHVAQPFGNLGGGHPVAPELLQKLDTFFGPRHPIAPHFVF